MKPARAGATRGAATMPTVKPTMVCAPPHTAEMQISGGAAGPRWRSTSRSTRLRQRRGSLRSGRRFCRTRPGARRPDRQQPEVKAVILNVNSVPRSLGAEGSCLMIRWQTLRDQSNNNGPETTQTEFMNSATLSSRRRKLRGMMSFV